MEQYVELKTSKGILRGVMHLPEDRGTKGKFPGVIMYHGFTGNRMEPGFMFVRFSRLLAENGIASIRFDFRGSGESDGTFDKMTLSGEIEDAAYISNYFRSRGEIDSGRVFLLGLSMGGTVAGYTAGSKGRNTAGLILWAPAGEMRDRLKEREEMIRMGEFKGNPLDMGGLLVGPGFIEDVQKLNILDTTSLYRGDVLIIHGTEDKTVPPKVSEHYKQILGEKATLKFIDGADHTFQGAEWISGLFSATLDFIRARI
ncbi:MAG: alpha/beta fold hydrolase [Spirochaetes bacterium]|nr:alpha/beta fold hydrolase [Spirochaetota bacterium]